MGIDNSTIWISDSINGSKYWNLNEQEEKLNNLSNKSLKKRSRICLHKSPNSSSQFMLIDALKESYFPIHRHKNSFEAYIPVFGKANLLVFDSNLILVNKILIDSSSKKNASNAICISPQVWHTFIIKSNSFRYFEFKETSHYKNDEILNLSLPEYDLLKIMKNLKIGEKIETNK